MTGKNKRKAPNCTSCHCGDHAFARLTRWGVALVSIEDRALLERYIWRLLTPKPTVAYAACELAATHGLDRRLHRNMVRSAAPMIDHRDGNGLDCRRPNLREATRAQNRCNVNRPARTKSGYRGVYFNTSGRGPMWKAAIKNGRADTHLGYFDDPAEAARVRDVAALKAFGEFAVLNFPQAKAG